MDLALQESNAKWKIVVGHHTIRSAGQHGNTDELVEQLLPILQVICCLYILNEIYKLVSFYNSYFKLSNTIKNLNFLRNSFSLQNDWYQMSITEKYLDIVFNELLCVYVSQANNIDLYINGHDHCLQHISSSDRFVNF